MPPAPRPRLVAKTASGTKASAPKSSHYGSRNGGSGPDPMQVWNRNRGVLQSNHPHSIISADNYSAAPQPTPKHFTDEELKQQYGIHLATRLQADADGKESKWADIDDDEDDWAPETIEWNDGTKIDLSQTSPAALLAEEQARAMVERERQEDERKSKLAAQQKPMTTVGPNATVLKPRSAAQPKSGGVVLKSASEKPILVAKAAAPTPVRSPWASLPPVERVPPIDINPPTQPSLARPQPNEHYSSSTMPPPPPQPAMEIAADSFTRTRRDNQNGNLGQLYNAQSGQYEPANAGRRGSVRKEQGFRPPSLLQRGSQHDQQGPTEPPVTNQTQRVGSHQDNSPYKRRGSSTVSGESGSLGRRTSMNKGSDVPRIPYELQQRRESQPLVSPSTPGSKPEHQPQSAVQSPAVRHSQPVHEALSAAASPYQGRNGAADVAQAVQRDDIAAQKALMKEKRELAIKRKKEEEEREEAAKKERIRIRMEQLGMAPLEERKEPEKKQIEKRAPDSVKMDDNKSEQGPEKPKATADASQTSVQPQDLPSSIARSPPKPPVLDASGAPQKYGLMRVHAAPPQQTNNDRLIIEKTRAQPPSQKVSPPGLQSKTESIEPPSSPMVNGVTVSQKHPDVPIYKAPENQNQNVAREPRQQPWNAASKEQHAYGGWNGQNVAREQTVSNSVWGPTSQSRTLGNGTFDRSLQRPQSRPQDQFSSPALAPIGPPRHLQRPRDAPELRPNNASPAPVVENFQTVPTFPPSDAPVPPSTRRGIPSEPISDERQISPPRLSATSQSRPQINHVDQPSRDPNQQKATLNAWNNFKVTDAENNRHLQQQHAAKLAEDLRNGIQQPEPQLPIMNETWRQVKIDEQNSQRQIVGVSRQQNTHDRPVGPHINGDVRPPFISPTGMPPITTTVIGRGSRFFPSAASSFQSQYQGAVRFPLHRRFSSPPLPDDEDHFHPAFSRDPRRPLVKLPGMKETSLSDDKIPKVRLPPTVITPVQSPQMSEVRAMPLRAASQPLVNNPSWQDRFNGLLGVKKTSPEKKFAHVADGFSATKVPLDLPQAQSSASVSLPPQNEETISTTLQSASKLVEDEEELFENREFGSLPAVSIPTKTPEIGWMEAKPPKRGQSKTSKISLQVEASSRDVLAVQQTVQNGNILIFVNLRGMGVPKSVALPGSSIQNTKSGASRPRNSSGTSKPTKGYKPRENSGNYAQHSKNSSAPPRDMPQSGPHSQARGQPGKNHPAWGPRTANAVH